VEGCKGGAFSGSVRFRQAINALLTSISNRTAIAMVVIVRPVLGLPAIMETSEMLV
jgi:hypothetical protein